MAWDAFPGCRRRLSTLVIDHQENESSIRAVCTMNDWLLYVKSSLDITWGGRCRFFSFGAQVGKVFQSAPGTGAGRCSISATHCPRYGFFNDRANRKILSASVSAHSFFIRSGLLKNKVLPIARFARFFASAGTSRVILLVALQNPRSGNFRIVLPECLSVR